LVKPGGKFFRGEACCSETMKTVPARGADRRRNIDWKEKKELRVVKRPRKKEGANPKTNPHLTNKWVDPTQKVKEERLLQGNSVGRWGRHRWGPGAVENLEKNCPWGKGEKVRRTGQGSSNVKKQKTILSKLGWVGEVLRNTCKKRGDYRGKEVKNNEKSLYFRKK